MDALTIISLCLLAVSTVALIVSIVTTTDSVYKRLPFIFDRKAYRAWKEAYNGKLYAIPNECDKYEHFVGFGVEWWGYVHIENSNLVCLLYKNEIETDDKIRVAIFDTEKGNGAFDKDNLLFTHFWEKHGDLLVEKALSSIIENYKLSSIIENYKGEENETEWE